MEQKIKNLENWLTNSDLARADLENRFETRLKKLENTIKELEKSNDAQITINQLFNKQIIDLEIRLKKEKSKSLTPINSIPKVLTTPPVSIFNRIFKK